jgi:hypothetical protein
MAKLTAYKSDLKKMNEGTWVELPDDFGDIQILTRGFTDAYMDARQARMRRAATKFGGDLNRIPQAEVRAILAELLVQHCVLGVRNLEDQDGNPVPFDLFCELIQEEAYKDLYGACLAAANIVSNEREADLAEAKKNSAKRSK